MTSSRLVLVAVVAAVVVALGLSFDGAPATSSAELLSAPIPSAGRPGSLSSTWFCAAGGAGTTAPPSHHLFLVNPAGSNVKARLTAFDTSGKVADRTVDVTAPGPTEVLVDALFGAAGLSVMVESGAGELVVEHRLLGADVADQVPCATDASDRWYFPAQTTLSNTSAQLYLFNPFPADASVDISADVGEGVRLPGELQGLVVPAGTTRMVNLGDYFQRREQFSVAVEARDGRIVAETAQTLAVPAKGDVPATRGLRLQLGVSRARSTWILAEGFTGPGVGERLIMFNPGSEPASVAVQLTPFGAAELPPEPFELEVPARRFAQLDLSAETRVPGEGLHSIRVETDAGTPIIVGRVDTISGGRKAPSSPEITARPPLSLGTAIGTGTPVAAPLWAATGMVVGPRSESLLAVHNPSAGTVRVSATVIGGSGDGTALADAVEIAPGDSVAIRTRGQSLGRGAVTVLVEATRAVVVERTITFIRQDDLSMGVAVPLPVGGRDLIPIGR